MAPEPEPSTELPIVCTLTPSELSDRREELLSGLLAKAVARDPVPGGFRWRFDPEAQIVTEIAAVIDGERRCCRFIRFLLVAEPGEGPVWFEVTGPPGAGEFLATLIDSTTA